MSLSQDRCVCSGPVWLSSSVQVVSVTIPPPLCPHLPPGATRTPKPIPCGKGRPICPPAGQWDAATWTHCWQAKQKSRFKWRKLPLNLIERLWRRSSQHQIWVRRQGMHPSTIRDPYLGPYHLTTQRLLPKNAKSYCNLHLTLLY